MRRMLLVSVLLLIVSLASLASSVAQEASPEADQANGSLLASLGYQELHITVFDDHFQVQGMVQAGRTLIAYENVGQESRHSFLLRLPDGMDPSAVRFDESEDAPPPWFFESIFPGFPGETLPGQTLYAVVDLTPGIYLLFDDFNASFVVGGGLPTEPPPAPESAATIELRDFSFAIPETIATGRQVWTVTNAGQQPHELLLAWSAEPITPEQVIELFSNESEDENATPVGGGPSLADIEPVGGVGWLSPGQASWTEVDIKPGTYIALCFVFDPETGMPHVMLGMVSTFTVAESGGTVDEATPETTDSYDY